MARKKVATKTVAEEKKWKEEWTKMMERDSKGSKKVLYGMVKAKKKSMPKMSGWLVKKERKRIAYRNTRTHKKNILRSC